MEPASVPFSAHLVGTDGGQYVVLLGELDMDTVSVLEDVLHRFVVEHGPDQIVLDLSQLAFMDSAGIALLVTYQNRFNDQGRRLVLRSPRPAVHKVFEVTHLLDYLNVETTLPAG